MKKIILLLALTTVLISCKEETKEKVKEASKAVGTDLKQVANSAKIISPLPARENPVL